MAAEIRLNVALDLAYFRQQLPKLTQAAAGYRLPLQVKFDARQIRLELNKLTGRREFRINLNDTAIKSALDNTKKLQAELVKLQSASKSAVGGTPVGTTGLSRTKSAGGFNVAEIKKLYEALAVAGVEGFERGTQKTRPQMVAAIGAISQDTISGLLNGLKSGDPKIAAAAKSLGNSLINSFKSVLGIASPSREFKYLGEFAAEGFEIGLTNGLKEAEQSAMARMRAMLAALKGEAAKFGPALMMAGGMGGGGQKGLREALLMAAGMGGMFTPQTVGQRMFGQARSGIAAQYGASPSAAFAGGTSGSYSMSRAPVQGPALPVRGIFDSTPAPRQIAGLLGPAGTAEATKAAAQALRLLEAEARSAARSASVFAEDAARASRRRGLEVASGQVPLGRGGFGMLPPGGGGGGGGGRGGFGGIGPNFGRDFGRGLVGGGGGGIAGEIASEFSNATKQVLLFGTAYKALAAITSLPGNIAQATASLQSFRNQLEAVTGGGEIMTSSMRLIEDTVARFNVPVQSARDGFVKLYASMQPAGIDLSTINNVFTGLSAAASTFGMSADQVDRMTYALAQMASKGQIMTEELKGQLGDVFPQAVSLFAEAAGFLDESMDEQAKSKGLSSFLEALEDGALKGEAMSKVLSNVGGLLNTKFGPSAEKAAGSFQNQMTKLNNALTEFYESFEPAAGAFLGEFVTPMVQALTTLGDAVKLALSDEPIKGNALAGYLRDELFPQLLNIKNALLAGAQQLGIFAQAMGVVLRPLAQLILGNQQFVSIVVRGATVLGLFRVAAAAVNATGIIPLIRNIIRYNGVFRIFLTQTASGTTGLTALRAASIQTGVGMRQAAVGVRVLATAIRTALVASAIGFAIVAIGALIEKIMQLKATADSIEGQRGAFGARIRKAAETGGSEGMRAEQRNVQAEITSRKRAMGLAQRAASGGTLSADEVSYLRGLGGYEGTIGSLVRSGDGFKAGIKVGARGSGELNVGAIQTDISNAGKALASSTQNLQKETEIARKNAAVVDKRFQDQTKLQPLDLAGGDGEGGGGGGKDAKTTPAQLLDLTKQLNQAKEEGRRLDEITLQYQIDVLNANQEQEDEIGRLISLEEARHRQAEALADLGEEIGKDMAQQYLEAEEQRKREYEGRKEINRLMVEARFAAGEITEKERDRLLFLQGQIDALDQLKNTPGVTPDDISAFQAQQAATPEPGSIGEAYLEAERAFNRTIDQTELLKTAANGIGDSFAKMFTDIATGAETWQQGLGNAFRSVASMFADMVAQMLAKWAAMQILQMFLPGAGASGLASSFEMPSNAFIPSGGFKFANGGIAPGGFRAFASGGVVTGPTMGLVGEGRFNEAVVPLPDGKSIPVELGSGAGSNISTNIVVNVNNGQASSQMNGSGGQSLGRELEGAVRSVILKESRPGGIIYNQR